MRVSEELDKILPALSKVKAGMGIVLKSASNPFFKSKYADLNAHLDVVEPLLQANGLLLFQPVEATDLGNIVESRIYHPESGQFVSSVMKLIGETDMQKVGSAVTYARRYTLGSLLGMKADDDDGESSIGRNKPKGSSYKPKSSTKSASKTKDSSKPSFANRGKSSAAPAPAQETGFVGEDDGL